MTQQHTATLTWRPGGAMGAPEPAEGSTLLVAVRVRSSIRDGYVHYWDYAVVSVGEAGLEIDGDAWTPWSWEDVQWYAILSGELLPDF